MKKVVIKKSLLKSKRPPKKTVTHVDEREEEVRPRLSYSPTKRIPQFLKGLFWFIIGFVFAGLVFLSLVAIYFDHQYKSKAIPGVFVDNVYVGEKTKGEIEKIFKDKNKSFEKALFMFSTNDQIATVSAKDIGVGYDVNLISTQATEIGKSSGILSNVYIILNSYINGTYLHTTYSYRQEKLESLLVPLKKVIYEEPVDAQFKIENNRVIAFKKSTNGKDIDLQRLESDIQNKLRDVVMNKENTVSLAIPIKVIEPKLTTEKANSFGIVEEIGSGTSYFYHSIPNRIHNVALAASKVTGILVAPGEEFSFDKYLGDVSSLTGYKEAYVIQNGKTVLGDGGGVCQVSTTLFRAALNVGLPITERHAHSYRVGYYEGGGFAPGIDATVFYPSVDLKFKNDTSNYILIQNTIDLDNLQLTYVFYGKKDGRQVSMTTPVVTNRISPPEALYQDDPTLPKGEIKQIDFAAEGATVAFNRTVTKNGKTLYADNFITHYAPWKAVFLKGTKE